MNFLSCPWLWMYLGALLMLLELLAPFVSDEPVSSVQAVTQSAITVASKAAANLCFFIIHTS